MPTKPSLTISAQNKIGGVQFFYDSLLKAGAFREFDSGYVLLDHIDDEDAKLTAPLEGAPAKIFHYGEAEDITEDFSRFAEELPKEPGLILTNWDFELVSLNTHRQPHLTVAHFCHDECYVSVAVGYAYLIDVFIAHNPHFADELRRQLPPDRAKDVHFLPFGIRQDPPVRRAANPDRPLRIVFIGRLHKTKGVMELPAVDDRLREAGIMVEWSILGQGPEKKNLENMIAGRENFSLSSPVDNTAMLKEAAKGDIFVLPSQIDGTPLAVMEAMSVGLVPVISEFNPGAHWMAPPDTGFVCPIDPAEIAKIVARLDADRVELENRSEATYEHAHREFEIHKRAEGYAEFFANWKTLKMPVLNKPWHQAARLGRRLLPDPVVMGIRRLRKGV